MPYRPSRRVILLAESARSTPRLPGKESATTPTLTLPLVALIGHRSSTNRMLLVMRTPPHATSIAVPRGSGQESSFAKASADRRTLRRHTGRIIGDDYATFSFPAHTRVASRPKSPEPCRPHTFRPSSNPYGLKQKRSVPPALPVA